MQICHNIWRGDFTLFLEAKPGEENKTICRDALSLFLPKLLALSKVCNPTEAAEEAGCFWCNRAPPLVAASPFTDGFCHSQTPTDLQSQHLNLNDLLLFIVQDHFQNDSVKWDPFCPCCEGVSAMQIRSRKKIEHISEYKAKKSFTEPLCSNSAYGHFARWEEAMLNTMNTSFNILWCVLIDTQSRTQ